MEQLFPPLVIGIIVGIVILAGLAHGTLGFGFPLISTPLVALLVDIKTAVLLTVIPNIVVNLISIIRGGRWRDSLGKHWPLAIWVILGTVVGTRLLLTVRPEPLQLLLAAMIILFLLQDRIHRLDWSWVKARPRTADLVFGITAGVFSGAVNVALPPLVIYLLTLGLTPIALTQTLNLCFLSGKIVQAAGLAIADTRSGAVLEASLPLVVLAAAALYAGILVQSRISVEIYRTLLHRSLAVMAAVLVLQAGWSLVRG